jgi:hypothetical protein
LYVNILVLQFSAQLFASSLLSKYCSIENFFQTHPACLNFWSPSQYMLTVKIANFSMYYSPSTISTNWDLDIFLSPVFQINSSFLNVWDPYTYKTNVNGMSICKFWAWKYRRMYRHCHCWCRDTPVFFNV